VSDAAYVLMEALAQVVYELECIVDDCNADESLAVRECCSEVRARVDEMLGLISKHLHNAKDDDGDDI
jgi:hypothetical protein